GLAGEQLQRVHQFSVGEHFIVKMRSRRASRRAHVADHVAALHLLALPHGELRQMSVSRRETETVIDHDEVAVIAAWRRQLGDATAMSGVRSALAPSTDVPPWFLICAGSLSMARAVTGSTRARSPSSLMADWSDSI